MSGVNCSIFFDQNEHGTYYTGQVVTGRVLITATKSKKYKGIKLQFCGFAACTWREKDGKPYAVEKVKKRHRKHMFSGHEDYIASTTFLMGSENGQPFSLEPGTNTYNFACPIPLNCPSSFEGSFGHIRYLAKVTFMRAGSSDYTHNVGFTVLKIVDLNQESPLLRAPINNEARESFCFVSTKAVQLRVDLHQSGYVPGQFILVSVEVTNESSVDCRKTIIELNLRATYTADTPRLHTATEKIHLLKKVCGPVPKHYKKHFAESLRVPATPPTCESISKLVRVSYEICVIAAMNHLMVNPKAVIPITVGNVPFVDDGNTNLAHSVPNLGSNAACSLPLDVPTTSAQALQMQVAIDDNKSESESETEDEPAIPPPSYEEAIFMTRNIADTGTNVESEIVNFTPRYPVYNVDGVGPSMSNQISNDAAAALTLAAAPNPPQKKRKKKPTAPDPSPMTEKPPIESPVQI